MNRLDSLVAGFNARLASLPPDPPRRRHVRRPRAGTPECGTDAGYEWHRYHHTARCDPCWRAHAEANRRRYRRVAP